VQINQVVHADGVGTPEVLTSATGQQGPSRGQCHPTHYNNRNPALTMARRPVSTTRRPIFPQNTLPDPAPGFTTILLRLSGVISVSKYARGLSTVCGVRDDNPFSSGGLQSGQLYGAGVIAIWRVGELAGFMTPPDGSK